MNIDRLDLLGPTNMLQPLLCEEVESEVKRPSQKAKLLHALTEGIFQKTGYLSPAELTTFTELRTDLGLGESAALAIAIHRNTMIACDDTRAITRAEEHSVPSTRVATTVRILLRAIHGQLITVADADAYKVQLEAHRFRMKLRSFSDLVP